VKHTNTHIRLIIAVFSLIFSSQILANESLSSTWNISRTNMIAKAQQDGTIPVIVRLKTNNLSNDIAGTSSALQASKENLIKSVGRFNTYNVKEFKHFPVTAMEVDSDALNSLLNNPEVAEVIEDALFEPSLLESTTLIGATSASSLSSGGNGQVVAILDTGVDRNHPFLANKVVNEACFSKTTSASTSICPDGSNNQIGTGAAQPCVGLCGHGTHVAGIAAGKGSDFSGVAPDADIMAIQVFSQFSSDYCNGSSSCVLAYTSSILSGLEHVYSMRNQLNIASVNLSLGGGAHTSSCDDSVLKPTIDLLKTTGIATIIASGNDGYSTQLNSPACISSAVKVGATTKTDSIASYSNSSSLLDLLAPGHSIKSSVVGDGYGYMSGTSMATPHVAGAFAVLRSKFPSKSVDELLAVLKSTGVSITDSRNSITVSRISLEAAIQAFTPIKVSNDFNPDGKADIFWRNKLTGENKVFLMNGTNVLESKATETLADLNWKVMGIGDFNGDKNADVIWRNELTGLNKIDIMLGTTIASSSVLNHNSDLNWKISSVSDFNNDEKDDLLWKNQVSGEIRMTFIDGTSITSDEFVGTVGAGWEVQETGDFNGDNKNDVLWRHNTNGRVWMYLMDGSSVINGGGSGEHVAFTSLTWDIKDIGDFNGDGQADILWKNNENGRVWIYLMNGLNILNGTTDAPGQHVAFSALSWDIKSASDFNGDGMDDILWRNDTTGENWMYLMNGVTITVNQTAGVTDLNWTIEKGK